MDGTSVIHSLNIHSFIHDITIGTNLTLFNYLVQLQTESHSGCTLQGFEVVKKFWVCALLCIKCCCFVLKPLRGSHSIELAHLKQKKKEHFAHFVGSWFGSFARLS